MAGRRIDHGITERWSLVAERWSLSGRHASRVPAAIFNGAGQLDR